MPDSLEIIQIKTTLRLGTVHYVREVEEDEGPLSAVISALASHSGMYSSPKTRSTNQPSPKSPITADTTQTTVR